MSKTPERLKQNPSLYYVLFDLTTIDREIVVCSFPPRIISTALCEEEKKMQIGESAWRSSTRQK